MSLTGSPKGSWLPGGPFVLQYKAASSLLLAAASALVGTALFVFFHVNITITSHSHPLPPRSTKLSIPFFDWFIPKFLSVRSYDVFLGCNRQFHSRQRWTHFRRQSSAHQYSRVGCSVFEEEYGDTTPPSSLLLSNWLRGRSCAWTWHTYVHASSISEISVSA